MTRSSVPSSSFAAAGRPAQQVIAHGLEGVVATDTQLSHIDGEAGRLILRGYSVEVLAEIAGFEEVCGLLIEGSPPGPETRATWQRHLGRARATAFERLARLDTSLAASDPMDALRGSIGQLCESRDLHETSAELIGSVAVFASAWRRLQAGEPLVEPDPTRSHAEDYLRMQRGTTPDPTRVRALDAYLVTVADHGMNASTFAARVVASTRSDAVSAVTAALGALKGPAHGGAPGPVLDMITDIQHQAEREPGTDLETAATRWIETELARGGRIMGMGHRVYRTRDPRAAVLERQIALLEQAGCTRSFLATARKIEGVARRVLEARKPGRRIEANVEFYTAVLLEAAGLPKSQFTPTFAVARTAGWLAHVREQLESGRLLRPRSAYTGPFPDASGTPHAA